jgi:hypothetical protein
MWVLFLLLVLLPLPFSVHAEDLGELRRNKGVRNSFCPLALISRRGVG